MWGRLGRGGGWAGRDGYLDTSTLVRVVDIQLFYPPVALMMSPFRLWYFVLSALLKDQIVTSISSTSTGKNKEFPRQSFPHATLLKYIAKFGGGVTWMELICSEMNEL